MRNLIFIISYFSFCNLGTSQIYTDTLYSGKTLNKSVNSINLKLIEKYKEFKYCDTFESSQIDKYTSKKSFVPFILKSIYDKKGRDVILNFESLIYSHLCDSNDYMYETIFMEMFYENDKLAQKCIEGLEEYAKIYEYEKKNDLIAHVGTLNWFFVRKNNVVYFVHRRLDDEIDKPIVKTLKNIILDFIDEKRQPAQIPKD